MGATTALLIILGVLITAIIVGAAIYVIRQRPAGGGSPTAGGGVIVPLWAADTPADYGQSGGGDYPYFQKYYFQENYFTKYGTNVPAVMVDIESFAAELIIRRRYRRGLR